MRVLTEPERAMLKLACRYVAARDYITTAGAADRFRRNPDLLIELAVQISEFARTKDGPAENLAELLAALAEAITPTPSNPAPQSSTPTTSPAPAPASTSESDEMTAEQ